LKRVYREITIGARQHVCLVYLKGDERLIHDRIVRRQHRYMPPSLLRSQIETLEEPGPDEHPITVVVHGAVAETVLEILRQLPAIPD
jgi:gluconate kinase